MLGILEKISPSELVSNGYISNHNKVWHPHSKFKVSFYLYFWINVTQINFENIKRNIQIIISDSCFQLKLWFNVDARVPSIPLLNFPFKHDPNELVAYLIVTITSQTKYIPNLVLLACNWGAPGVHINDVPCSCHTLSVKRNLSLLYSDTH